LLPGYNIFKYPAKEVFKNIGNEWKKWLDIVSSKNIKTIKDNQGNILGYSARPNMPRFLTFIVGGIMLLTLTLATVAGAIIKGISKLINFFKFKPSSYLFSSIIPFIPAGWLSGADKEKESADEKKPADAENIAADKPAADASPEAAVEESAKAEEKAADAENIAADIAAAEAAVGEPAKAEEKPAGSGESAVSAEAKSEAEADKTGAPQAQAQITADEKLAKSSMLRDGNLRVSANTLKLSAVEIQTVIDRLNKFGIDPESLTSPIPAATVIKISRDENWLEKTKAALEKEGAASIDNIINVPKKVLVLKALKDRLKDNLSLSAASVQRRVEANISQEKRGKSVDANLQIFVGNNAENEANMAASAGFISATLEQAEAKPEGSRKLSPNTITPYEYKGKTYKVKVEHYVLQIGNIVRITAIVKPSASLKKAIEENEGDLKEIEKETFEKSILPFAADIENDKSQMQYRLDVSGIGMVVYSGDIEKRRGDISAQGGLIQGKTPVLELSGSNKKKYFSEDVNLIEKAELLYAGIALVKEYGAAWQMPGYIYGLTINADSAKTLSSGQSAQTYLSNEQSKNVSIARVSSGNMRDVIETLWGEKAHGEKAKDTVEINRIRNLLNSGKEIRKIVDLKASDLIDNNGNINRSLIQHTFESGFDGIYADLSGLPQAEAEIVLKAIKEISAKYAVDAQNYVSLDEGIIGDFVKGFTRIVNIPGEKINAQDVKIALDKAGDYEGSPLAVDIEGIYSGDELTLAQGRIAAAFTKNTSGISKDKFDGAAIEAQTKYETYYEKEVLKYGKEPLKSDDMVVIDSGKIPGLKEFMKEGGAVDFGAMKAAMIAAGIEEKNKVYRFVELAAETNTDKSYAIAKAKLRIAFENYLESQYLAATNRTSSLGVGVSDRNSIRGLMLYMAQNGEELSVDKIKAMLEEQKTLLDGSKTLLELSADYTPARKEILVDPLADDSKEKALEKTARAKQALTVVSENVAASGINKAMETFKEGAFASTKAVRQILSAA
jgi:hypothetical protein